MEARYLLGQTIILYNNSGNYDLIQLRMGAHSSGPPPHLHNSFTEFIIIIEGELEVILGSQVKTLKKGESIEIPRNVIHTFRNTNDSECKMFSIHDPKGFSKFFQKFGIPVEESNALERSLDPTIIEEVIRTATDFDMEIKL